MGRVVRTTREPVGLFWCFNKMEGETKICKRYEAQMAVLAALDYAYYFNLSPTTGERTSYYIRQAIREQVRLSLYAELSALRPSTGRRKPPESVKSREG
jgi:hypothetical protein